MTATASTPDCETVAVAPPLVTLRALREAHGLTPRQLMERMIEHGVLVRDPATIRNVELGHKIPSNRLITAWAKALGLRPIDVIIPARAETRTAA